MASMVRLAITGGICEGKSTVASYIREIGYEVANADQIAKDLLVTPAVQDALRVKTGRSDPITVDQIRGMFLEDASIRRYLNSLLHPLVREALTLGSAYIHEVPLLIETCMQGDYDRVWVVTCGPELQRRRLIERLGSEEAADSMLAKQLPTRAKLPFADRIIRTDWPEQHVREYVVNGLLNDLKEL